MSITLSSQRALMSAHAAYNGTPAPDLRPVMNLFLFTGQSHATGAHDVGGAYAFLDARGWNGSRSADGPSSGPQSMALVNETRRLMSGYYSTRAAGNGLANPGDIAPCHFFGSGSGSPTASFSHGPAVGETIEYGFASELDRWTQAHDMGEWCFVTSAQGGTTLAQISALSSPPKFIPSLPSVATASLTIREQLYRGMIVAKQYWEARGYRVRVGIVYNNQIHGDMGNAAYDTATYTDFVNIDAVIKSVFGTGALAYAKKTCCASNTGAALDSNLTPYVDQQLLNLLPSGAPGALNPNNLPIILVGPTYIWSQRIHYYSYTGEGAMLADRFARFLWNNEDSKPLTITWSRVIGGSNNQYLGTPSEPIQFVDASGMGVVQRHTTGGIDTYGIVLGAVGGGSITNVTLSGGNILMTQSGTHAAGDRISDTGQGALYSNIRSTSQRLSLLPDQDPTATITSGLIAYQPAALPAGGWDISKWAWPQSQVMT